MNFITLISDWNLQDPYVSQFKGLLYSSLNNLMVIDVTHDVPLCNVNETAFLLSHSFASFPIGTVHIILTGATSNLEANPVVVSMNGHYFVGHDSGVFSLMFRDLTQLEFVRIYESDQSNFLAKLVELASFCLAGNVAEHTNDYSLKIRIPFDAQYIPSSNRISGHVAHIDANGNVLTNIPFALFNEKVTDNRFTAIVGSHTITRFHKHYVEDVEPYLTPNSLGVIEITAYHGRLSILSKWQRDAEVEILCYRSNQNNI